MARFFVPASSQYLSGGTTSGLTGFPFTFSCWFKPTIDTSSQTIFILQDAGLGFYLHVTFRGDQSKQAQIQVNDGTYGEANTSTALAAGNWYHICAVFLSNTSKTIYLNALGAVTLGTSITFPAVTLTRLGAFTSSGTPSNFANGAIAEAICWNIDLYLQEIISLAAGADPIRIRNGNIRPFWPLNEAGGPAIDAGFGHINLVPNGGPTASPHPPIRQRYTPPLRRIVWAQTPPVAGTGGLRYNSSLSGLGASGPFFHDRLA
jgi:hypothetical protein